MFLGRIGSLNGLAQTQSSRFWHSWLNRKLPSADSLGRIMECVDSESIRLALQELYRCLKKNKALQPTLQGLMVLVLDGHESHTSYRRCCSGCLQRRIKFKNGWRTLYYHRHVTAMLLSRPFPLLLDAEPQRPEEDEVQAALRLLERLQKHHLRAFDIVAADALYARPEVFAFLERHKKFVVTVLKKNQPELLQEAKTLLQALPAQSHGTPNDWQDLKDVSGFPAFAGCRRPLRVVQSQEGRTVKRQLDKTSENLESNWFWLSDCPAPRVSTETIARIGHARWTIENQGFNEIVNRWHADHVYKHSKNAMLNFWLLAMLAFNLFSNFVHRNLKNTRLIESTRLHLAQEIAAEIYAGLPASGARGHP
jgi:hypothetical protein